MRRRVGGVIAAYLVVLQAILAGLALGAAPVSADPFSALCRPGVTEQSPDKSQHHKALPDCCVASCAMHLGGMAPPAVEVAPPAPLEDVAAAPAWTADVAPPSDDRTPSNPRAPPAGPDRGVFAAV